AVPVVVRPGGGDGHGAVRAQALGGDEPPLADRRPAARRYTGGDRERPPLRRALRASRGGRYRAPRRWRDMPKVVFSSTISTVDWNTRLVTGDAVTEITRLKAEDGGPIDSGGATLAAAAMRAGLIDEYVLATAPVLVGSGTPFFTALDNWVNL